MGGSVGSPGLVGQPATWDTGWAEGPSAVRPAARAPWRPGDPTQRVWRRSRTEESTVLPGAKCDGARLPGRSRVLQGERRAGGTASGSRAPPLTQAWPPHAGRGFALGNISTWTPRARGILRDAGGEPPLGDPRAAGLPTGTLTRRPRRSAWGRQGFSCDHVRNRAETTFRLLLG